MRKSIRAVLIALISIVFLNSLVALLIRASPYDPKMQGGDSKNINGSSDPKHLQLVTLERPIGGHGTKFVAIVQIEGENPSLVKGYVVGSTGANFSIGGQPLGFGISSPEFWIERNLATKAGTEGQMTTVFVNFKRPILFIFSEQVTARVGDVIISKASQATSSSVGSGPSTKPIIEN